MGRCVVGQVETNRPPRSGSGACNRKERPDHLGFDPDAQIAYALAGKGILEQTHAEPGKSRFRTALPEWVWLPNTLVDGFGAGDSPLARLRQIRDKRAIPLLLDCYRLGNLAEDGGLPWQMVRQNFKRVRYLHKGSIHGLGFLERRQVRFMGPALYPVQGQGPRCSQ